MHLDSARAPGLTIRIESDVSGTSNFGALGKVIGKKIETLTNKPIPYIQGISRASLEELKSFCASLATYAGEAMFHMERITPEASLFTPPQDKINISQDEIEQAIIQMNDAQSEEVDFVSLGCPHLSIVEIARIAGLLAGKKVKKTFWITTSRPVKRMADQAGYTQIIEEAGVVFAVDTCCVVAPLKGRFHVLATDSAKACYYAGAKNKFRTVYKPFDEVVAEALH
jgi:predicted aconitase